MFSGFAEISRKYCVEASYTFYILTYTLVELTNTNVLLQKTCRHNSSGEPDLRTPCDNETLGVEYVASVNSVYRFWEFMLPLLSLIFVTAWSDKAGKNRKQIILFAMLGQIVAIVSLSVQSYFWYWPPFLVVCSEFLNHVLFLGPSGVRTFTLVLVCDLTNETERTLRLTMLLAIDLVCTAVSSGLSGYLMRNIGFFYTYLVSLSLCLVAFVFALNMRNAPKSSEVRKFKSIWKMIDVRQVIESFRVVFKKRAGKPRWVISTLFVITVLGQFALRGEGTVLYLYLRYRFQWDEQRYGAYVLYKIVGSIIGMILCSLILSKLLKLHDGIVGMFAGFWDVLAVIGYLWASHDYQLYLVPLLDIFHGMALSVCESFASKFFNSDELGRFFSVYLTFCVLVPFCAPAYNVLFQYTKDFYPAAIFLLSLPINTLLFLLYGVCYFGTRKLKLQVPQIQK